MPDLINEDEIVSKERLITTICLIMILEHEKLGLEELINATGMSFNEIRSAAQNLVNLRLVHVIPTAQNIPQFKLINANDAREYLHKMGVRNE
jgi:hypothetical protein